MFVCPVSKEVSNPHENPIVLRCGHVISEYSFNRIVENRTKTKFKCPVCHTEQKITDIVQMHFWLCVAVIILMKSNDQWHELQEHFQYKRQRIKKDFKEVKKWLDL
jgi:hypothetical protein